MKTYTTPAATAAGVFSVLTAAPHVLIAGTTGAGKSVLLRGVVCDLLTQSPAAAALVLIDPKRVELYDITPAPHVLYYADTPETYRGALAAAVELMARRFSEMRARGLREYDGRGVWIVIDEFADMIQDAPDTARQLVKIAQIGRAARVHLVACTQRPTRDIITGALKVNFDYRVALRVPSAQDSRNIIDTGGAELLPRYGRALLRAPEYTRPVIIDIPNTTPDDLRARVEYWKRQA